jgi:DNA-binding transcriptional ArsR family regulator
MLKTLLLKHMLNHQNQLDGIFHALADPTRRAIVERLSGGPASVGELARHHPMSLAAVVQHLQLLESCKLITSRKVGRVRTCQIEAATLETLEGWLTQRRRQWDRLFDRLAQVLDEQEQKPKSPKRKKP